MPRADGRRFVGDGCCSWLRAASRDLVHSDATGALLADYHWTYDDAHRVDTFGSLDGSADYGYDGGGQLTSAVYDYRGDEAYQYDGTGNRKTHSVGDHNRVTADGSYSYEYDDEGNRTRRTHLTTGEVTEYTWDIQNRLVGVTTRASGSGPVTDEVEYTYDMFGRRIAKAIDSDGDGTNDRQEVYVYDGESIVLQFDGLGDLTHRYLHGPAVDQVLADEAVDMATSTSSVLWPLADNLGTVRDLVEYDADTGTSSAVNHLTYRAFGQVTSETNAAVDHIFGYTGREVDAESDLYYYRARYYDPQLGQFISEDPIDFAAGDENLYRYVGNGVTNAVDPSGREEQSSRSLWPVSHHDRATRLYMQGRISPSEWHRAHDVLPLHATAQVRLQSPNSLTGATEWIASAVVGAGRFFANSAGVAGAYRLNQWRLWVSGQHGQAAKNQLAHDAMVLAESQYSPINTGPLELAAKAERVLRDPGPVPGEGYLVMIDPNYRPPDRTPDYWIPSSSEQLRSFAYGLSPESAAMAKQAVAFYDAGADLAVSLMAPQFAAAKGATWADDLARLGRIDDASLLQRYADEVVASRGAVASMQTSRRPGQLYTKFDQLERRLSDWGIRLERNADEAIDAIGEARGVSIGALFEGKINGAGLLRVRANATRYEVLHELGHVLDFRRNPTQWVRPASNEGLALLIRVQAVYNRLRNSRSWYLLNLQERLHAYRYIESLGGNPRFNFETGRTINRHGF